MKTVQLYQIHVIYSKTKTITLPQQLPVHAAIIAARPVADRHQFEAYIRIEPVLTSSKETI